MTDKAVYRKPESNVFLMDCMEGLKATPDKAYDLAICDPPYGGGQHFNFRFGTGDQVYENHRPDPLYFNEIKQLTIFQP